MDQTNYVYHVIVLVGLVLDLYLINAIVVSILNF